MILGQYIFLDNPAVQDALQYSDQVTNAMAEALEPVSATIAVGLFIMHVTREMRGRSGLARVAFPIPTLLLISALLVYTDDILDYMAEGFLNDMEANGYNLSEVLQYTQLLYANPNVPYSGVQIFVRALDIDRSSVEIIAGYFALGCTWTAAFCTEGAYVAAEIIVDFCKPVLYIMYPQLFVRALTISASKGILYCYMPVLYPVAWGISGKFMVCFFVGVIDWIESYYVTLGFDLQTDILDLIGLDFFNTTEYLIFSVIPVCMASLIWICALPVSAKAFVKAFLGGSNLVLDNFQGTVNNAKSVGKWGKGKAKGAVNSATKLVMPTS